MEYEVTAVEKPYGALGHDSITAIGNHRDGWSVTALNAMRRLAMNRDAFYVVDGLTGKRAYLTTMRDANGRITLRAVANNRPTDLLLGLRPMRDLALID